MRKKASIQRMKKLQSDAEKRSKRFRKYTKNQNRNVRRRSKRHKRNRRGERLSFQSQIQRQRILIPELFSISKEVNGVLKLIYDTKKILEAGRIKHFDFDFSQVKELDDGAVTILLSLCHDISRLRKRVRINIPKNLEARKYLQNSGFRKFFQGHEQNKNPLNITLKKGRSTILQKDTVPMLHNAMRTIHGTDQKNQKLQGMLIELMTNSVNHAYLNNNKEKSWYISNRHDQINNKVEFCFVDNGDGIINTINVRLAGRLFYSNEQILEKAFEGEFRSRTKQKNRGRGLIVIQKNHDKRVITNLKVITNNVILDFDSGIVKKLDTPFSGTFYSWTLDKTCTS